VLVRSKVVCLEGKDDAVVFVVVVVVVVVCVPSPNYQWRTKGK